MNRTRFELGRWIRAGLLPLCAIWVVAPAIADRPPELTPEAEEAVRALFPGATITEIAWEIELGVGYFEVELTHGGDEIEVEVTPEGVVGEVERELDPSDTPASLQRAIREWAGDRPVHVEKHEIHGRPRGDAFVPVVPPRIAYEVVYRTEAGWREVLVDADGNRLHALEALEEAGEERDEQQDEDEDTDDPAA